MKKQKIVIGVLLLIAIFSFSSLAMGMTPSGSRLKTTTVELDDVDLSAGGFLFGPGSSVPLYDPVGSSGERLIFLSNVEPVKVIWTIYNPYMHKVTEISHNPSIKKEGSFSSGGNTYKWAFADATAFVVPAFATKGTWLASPSYEMADGSIQTGSYQFYAFDVTRDDAFASIFMAPYYHLFGVKMPPMFFFPFGLIWLPLLYLGLCKLFPKTIGYFVDYTKKLVDAGRGAKRKWGKKSRA